MSIVVWAGVAALGGAGAIARFRVDRLVQQWVDGEFPFGTLAVNLSGSFALGLLTGAGVGGDALFLAGTALLGSYTTFSTLMLETERLAEEGEERLAWLDLGVSLAAGLAVALAGFGLGEGAVSGGGLKLSVYFGESDRVDGRLLSDVLIDLFAQHGVKVAILMRGVEGFGFEQHVRTDRLLSLSEDLPLVVLAVAERSRIEALLEPVTALVAGGLITLERAQLLDGRVAGLEPPEATKLTLYLGRDERVAGRPAYLELVEHLRRSGLAGATVLLGVDGVIRGRRQRARFFSRNESVPLMVVCVGGGETVGAALEGLPALGAEPIATLERIQVCKRDGRLLAEPQQLPATGGGWQKLAVYAGEQARHGGHPLASQLVRRLREQQGSGATSLRGVWGFSGDHPPHGDRLFALRRRVPVVTTILDRPDRIRAWFRLVDELTDEAGLVTSERVPGYLAVAQGQRVGRLELGPP